MSNDVRGVWWRHKGRPVLLESNLEWIQATLDHFMPDDFPEGARDLTCQLIRKQCQALSQMVGSLELVARRYQQELGPKTVIVDGVQNPDLHE